MTSDWPDGNDHPDDYHNETCITSPNCMSFFFSCTTFIYAVSVHTQNETMVAGSAFAISYTSDLSAVTDEDLVVFTVLEQFVFLVPSCFCFRLSVVWQYPVEANGDFQGS